MARAVNIIAVRVHQGGLEVLEMHLLSSRAASERILVGVCGHEQCWVALTISYVLCWCLSSMMLIKQNALLLQARHLRSRLQPCHGLLLTCPASAT